jgi:hypothetical protein
MDSGSTFHAYNLLRWNLHTIRLGNSTMTTPATTQQTDSQAASKKEAIDFPRKPVSFQAARKQRARWAKQEKEFFRLFTSFPASERPAVLADMVALVDRYRGNVVPA